MSDSEKRWATPELHHYHPRFIVIGELPVVGHEQEGVCLGLVISRHSLMATGFPQREMAEGIIETYTQIHRGYSYEKLF